MQNRKQLIAKFCWDKIKEILESEYKDEDKKKLKSYIKNSGPLILNNGLIETIIFYREKENKEGAYRILYQIINEFWKKFIIKGLVSEIKNHDDIQRALIYDLSSIQVLQITEQVLVLINLLKSIANAEIEVND